MEIENIRKTLVTVRNEFDKELEAQRIGVDRAKGEVSATAQTQTFNIDTILQFVN